MPRRTDIKKILVIGSGPIVIGQACEFDYSGAQACKVLRDDGFEVVLVNSNPATIMTDPGLANRTYVEPITPEFVEKVIIAEKPDALLPTLGGQTGLNCAVALAEAGTLEKHGVELIGAKLDVIKKGEDRKLFAEAMERIGLDVPRGDYAYSVADAERIVGRHRPAVRRAPQLHDGRRRRRHRLQHRRAARDRRSRRRALAAGRGAHRGERHRLERVRDGGHARRQRQRRDRVLHRERRPDGRAHRRLDHRRACSDAHRPRVPDHARRLDRDPARDRRRDRRLQRAVRGEPGQRPHDRHRDEPARLALLGARLQGDRLPDREDRREARGGLHARRDRQRHHARDAGVLRAEHRLHRRQGAALGVREVPRHRRDAHHPHEVGGRGDGHRPHLRRGARQGVPLARERPRRPGSDGKDVFDEHKFDEHLAIPNENRLFYVAEAFRRGRSVDDLHDTHAASTRGSCAASRRWSPPRTSCAAARSTR